tara:strand:+ start:3854 stop:4147 length:294 start_codon:yes stop_codon:yes gene_type:complete
MIYVKLHEEGVVAMADAEVIGKEFEEGDLYLQVSERFYKGEEKNKEEVVKLMKEANNLNIVGKEVVGIALEGGFIKKDDVKVIQGVPHVQVYRIHQG